MWDDPQHIAGFTDWLDAWIAAGGTWAYTYQAPTGIHFCTDVTPQTEWLYFEPAISDGARTTFLVSFRSRWA